MRVFQAAVPLRAFLACALCIAPAHPLGQTRGLEEEVAHPRTQEEQVPAGIPTTATEFFERVAEIREYLQAFVDTSAVPGLSLGLGVGDRFTRFEAFGYADAESGRPVTPHTRFRIGSISKTLTAEALGRLIEKGRIDLDAMVQTYVPEFPEKQYPITLRNLAYHQSGIRHYRGNEALSNRPFSSVLDALSVFADDPLLAEPGATFTYSTHGYTLLSAAMERAAGTPFLELMKEEVLVPLRMTQTAAELKGNLDPLQATGYELGAGGEPEVAPETDLSNKWAGGGYVSTAGDLMKFARAHLGNPYLGPTILDLLWTAPILPDGTASPMGMGWQIARDQDGREIVVAGGNAIGGTTVVFAVPEEEVVVVFMTNIGNAPIRGVPARVLGMLLGAIPRGEEATPAIHDPPSPSSHQSGTSAPVSRLSICY